MARVRLEGRGAPGRPALLGLGVLLALAVVALASRAHSPTGGGGRVRHVSGELLFEYLFLFALAGALIVVPLVGRAFWTAGRERALPERKNWMVRVFAMVAAVTVVMAILLGFRLLPSWDGSSSPPGRTPTISTTVAGSGSAQQPRRARVDWLPAAVVGSILLVAALIAAGVMRSQRTVRRKSPAAMAEQLSNVLDETLDDLHGEKDPRRAVIAAYARMERALAWFGLPREVFEAPLEYLARVLAELHASAESVRRLTELFERAKFSAHAIGPALKNDAIEALVAVRDELRAYR